MRTDRAVEAAAATSRLGALGGGPGPVAEPATPSRWVPDQSGLFEPTPPDALTPATSVTATTGGVAHALSLLREWIPPPSGRAVLALAVVTVTCIAVTAWVVLHAAHGVAAGGSQVPRSATGPPPALASPVASLVVDVGGRVRRPGLVTLPAGARVADALRAAGGALRAADIATLDLAARVVDGQLLLVGVVAGGGGGTSSAGSGPLNLNAATVDQLDALPGIGPVLARHIVEWRDAHGGFTSVDQLHEVSGVGPRKYDELAPLVTV